MYDDLKLLHPFCGKIIQWAQNKEANHDNLENG